MKLRKSTPDDSHYENYPYHEAKVSSKVYRDPGSGSRNTVTGQSGMTHTGNVCIEIT